MKRIILSIVVASSILAACNNSSTNNKEVAQTAAANVDTSNATSTKPTGPIKDILSDYLQMKNALAKDNDVDAATAGNKMVTTFANFSTTALTPEQSKLYKDIQDDAKEHAEHIGKNAGNIKHQREHFDMLSADVYQLVKTFGSGQTLYYDHCPMYNGGKGANWLSENKEITNPYYGDSMLNCGTVTEELK